MNKQIASVIKDLRLARGFTQERLAEELGKSPGYVGMLEQGRAKPSYDVMKKLITEFQVDANLFFEEPVCDAVFISANIVQTVQNMTPELQECIRYFTHIIDQFSKEVRGSNENCNM